MLSPECRLTGLTGASSVVPREDSTAFSTQIEGTFNEIHWSLQLVYSPVCLAQDKILVFES